jgi:heme O synthase-like polyprenyltransferase
MQIEALELGTRSRGSLKDYVEVIKPRENGLLVFIAAVTALVASAGAIPIPRLIFLVIVVLAASSGANGLTNCLLLSGAALALFFRGQLGWLFLAAAVLASMMIVYSSWRLLRSHSAGNAWRLYKLSAFPYLGVLFLAMAADVILRI